MEIHELMWWGGLAFLVASCGCLGLIGFRNSAWFGSRRSMLAKLRPFEIKVAKAAGLFFLGAVLCFILGAVIR